MTAITDQLIALQDSWVHAPLSALTVITILSLTAFLVVRWSK